RKDGTHYVTSPGRIEAGRPSDRAAAARLEALAGLLRAGKTDVAIVDDPWPTVWRKLVLNAVLNPTSAVLDATYGELLGDPGRAARPARSREPGADRAGACARRLAAARARGLRIADAGERDVEARARGADGQADARDAQGVAARVGRRRVDVEDREAAIGRSRRRVEAARPQNDRLRGGAWLRPRSTDRVADDPDRAGRPLEDGVNRDRDLAGRVRRHEE